MISSGQRVLLSVNLAAQCRALQGLQTSLTC
jgi:hypothetical protein